jgi:hypothetical protein
MDELLVFAGSRFYQMIVWGVSSKLEAEDREHFFDSFTITPDSEHAAEKNPSEPVQITTGVSAFECPTYPEEAKEKHLQGSVQMEVETDGKKIMNLKISGHPLLSRAAEANIRTWKFADSTPISFSVVYLYVNEGEYQPDAVYKCRAKLRLPNKVEVSTSW